MPAPEQENPETKTPEQPHTGAQPAAQPQAERPRPEFGEYAPEGWSWTPPGTDEGNSSATPGSGTGTASAPTDANGRTGVPSGVPHNLGARPADGQTPPRQTPATPGTPGTPTSQAPQAPPVSGAPQPGGTNGEPAPYRASAPGGPAHQHPQPVAPLAGAPQFQGAVGAKKPRTADRVITIILLAVGAFGALNMAASGFALAQQMHLMATMIGVENVTVPEWIGPVGTVIGLVVLLVYALNVIYSIQRIRAGKLAFWVPLAAAGIAFVLIMIVSMIAMYSIPELMQQMNSDPYGSLDRMMKYVEETPTS